MGTEERRLAMYLYFQETRGFSRQAAGRVALAMMPLDDDWQPGRRFEKAARKLSRRFSKAAKRAAPEEADRLAITTLEQMRALAVEHGEHYYSSRYDRALGGVPSGA